MRLILKASLFVAALCIVMRSCFANQPHTITAPTYIKLDTPTNVAVNLHGLGQAQKTIQGTLKFTFDGQDGFEQVGQVGGQANKPIIVPVTYQRKNYKKMNRKQYVELTLTAQPGNIKIPAVKMEIKDESGYIEIMTDRPVYRPGERVRYTIAAMDQDLTPEEDRIVEVTVQIPPDFIGVERKNLLMPKNERFIQEEFEIPEVPEVGTWRIQARYENEAIVEKATRKFSVQRYVVPTFNVDVKIPKLYILTGGDRAIQEISGKITGEYSYGKKVFGNYYLTGKLQRPGESAETFYTYPAELDKQAAFNDGVHDFTIPISSLQDILKQGESFESLMTAGATVYIEATIANNDEGLLESGISPHLQFTPSPFMIDISRMSKYFTPGLAFPFKFDLVDVVRRQPVPNVPVTIKLEGHAEIIRKITDDNGQIYYTHNMPDNKEAKAIEIATNTFELEDNEQARTIFQIKSYQSPSDNFIQLTSRLQLAKVPTAGFEITAFFDAWVAANGEIRYLVLSRGEIITGGSVTPGVGVQTVSLTMDVTHEMVPAMRVLAYYKLPNGEIVSNSIWVDVEDQCQVELTIGLGSKEVLPGGKVAVTYTGSPNAMIAISAVDRASYFIYNESRLSRNELFQSMDSYDLGCMRQGGKNGQHVFEVTGMQIIGGSFERKEEFLPPCDENSRKKRADPGCDKFDTQSTHRISPYQNRFDVGSEVTISCISGFEISPHDTEVKCIGNGVWDKFIMPTCVSSVSSRCEFDSQVENNAKLSCAKRAKYVSKNIVPEKDAINCARLFFTTCEKSQRSREVGRGSSKARARAASQNAVNIKQSGKLRSDFSENMVWHTDKIGENGKLIKDEVAKHSITTFEFDAMSLHKTQGFCIAPTEHLKVFQNIFIQVQTPYSIKKMEQVDIRVTVFNYGENLIMTSLDVIIGDHLCSHFKRNKASWLQNLNIEPDSAGTASFSIQALRVPPEDENESVMIEIHLRDREKATVIDKIRKYILVEPEGVLKTDVRDTRSFDLEGGRDNFEFEIDFPQFSIPDTKKCEIYAYANYMGPVIQMDSITNEPRDIGALMRVPRGCGEQTMIYSGPTVFAFKYLRSVGKMPAGSAQETAALDKIQQGYTREMVYRSDTVGKKAWAVWAHAPPSMWLNAFVNKVFGYSKKCVPNMDVTTIVNSINWITDNQQASGEFDKVYKVHHTEMHGAVGGSITLTAYVLISLEESKHVLIGQPAVKAKAETAITKAIAYLQANENHIQMNLPYVMALTSYGINLARPNSPFANRIFAKLWNSKQYSGGNRLLSWTGADLKDANAAGLHTYWYSKKRSSIDVETTAYALLAYLTRLNIKQATQGDIDSVKKIAAWMVEQRDENGAFTTTQDTVIGLQALGEYMTWANTYNPPSKDISLDITYGGPDPSTWFPNPLQQHLDNSNENFTTPIRIPDDVINHGGKVPVTVEGTGRGTISYRCSYRTDHELELRQFDLSVTTEKLTSSNFKLVIDVKTKVGVAQTGQAIIQIGLLTGYGVMEASLEAISKTFTVDGIIDRYEITQQNLILYVDTIQRDPSTTFAVIMQRRINVGKPEPVSVKVYDYYQPTIQASTFYALPDDLVLLRTTEQCTGPQGIGEDMCKCAEGGCAYCRHRADQLEVTQCIDPNGACNLCTLEDPRACTNMTELACKSNFVYIVTVTKEIPENEPGVLVEFEAEINTVIKAGSDTNARNQNRKFRMRNDCYYACKDPILEKPDRKISQAESYIAEDRQLLIMSQTGPTKNKIDKAGNTETSYFLTEGTFMERAIPKSKCDNSRINKIKNKCTRMGLNDKCDKILRTIQACNNLLNLQEVLSKHGCDAVA